MSKDDEAPMTIDQAVATVCNALSTEDRYRIRAGEVTLAQAVNTTGRWLQKKWKLDRLNNPLAADLRRRFDLFGDQSDVAEAILIGVWASVKNVSPNYDEWAKDARASWSRKGVNPSTGSKE